MDFDKKIYGNPIQKRVLAVNDLSCFGKCSLTVAFPIISAENVEVVTLPTALLSTHTGGFEGYHVRVLTEDMRAILAHWKREGIRFDGLYTGYMCGTEQIDIALDIAADFLADDRFILVDPVMGDGGRLYPAFTAEYARRMRELCAVADVITPNITEAAFLTDMTVGEIESAEGGLDLCFKRLFALGCKNAVITGVQTPEMRANGQIGYVGAERESAERAVEVYPYVDAFLHGCGDVFASKLCACLTSGGEFLPSVRAAAQFTENSILRAVDVHPAHWYGLPFEAELYVER
ncbi:MAG: pyridoxamine kinase [Ruminococcaceae bacterium]|nr:pyridoxamine kinase [Oscillospiraceae bacterium]